MSFNSKEPLESLTESLDECADFATAAGETVLETQLVCIVNGIVTEMVQ